MEHFKAVEAALYEAAGFQEECSRAQVVAAPERDSARGSPPQLSAAER